MIAMNTVPSHQTTKFGKYFGLEVAGRGNTATVYHGYDPFSDREVAIKVSGRSLDDHEDRLTRKLFYNEAQTAGRLVHPHIVRLLDAGEESGRPYLVMEYVAGGHTLQHHCRADSLLSPTAAAEAVYHCARALDYSHRNGVIHRDIKPTNVLMGEASAKLTDFGIAQCSSIDTTQIAGVVGSPRYMSPEQISQQPITPATDIYSLGVVLHELLTGNALFHGDNLASLMHTIVNQGPRVEHRAYPVAGAAEIVRQAVARQPEARFGSAGEFAEALCDVFGLSAEEDDIGETQKRECLSELEFFCDFSADELTQILRHASWHHYDAGDTIIVEGNMDLSFYIIADGSVTVKKADTTLCRLEPGACFGEMGYLSESPRTATVIANEPVMLLSLQANTVRRTTEGCQLRFNEAFIRTLIARLSQANNVLAHRRTAA